MAAFALATLLAPRPTSATSADAGFARDMRQHHEQAVRLALIVRDRTGDAGIRVLANDITFGQQAQIGEMTGWLEAWRLPRDSGGAQATMAWMGHASTGPMPGMASPDEVARLSQLPPDDLDRLFLQLMIRHHQGGLLMAEAGLKLVGRPEVRRMAANIAATQRDEILAMGDLLRNKGGAPLPDVAMGHEVIRSRQPADPKQAALLLAVGAGVLSAGWLLLGGVGRSERPAPGRLGG